MKASFHILLLLAIACIIVVGSSAQTLTLHLKKWPSGSQPENIFVAGNFNGWQAGLAAFQFNKQQQLTIPLSKPLVDVAFKCTLGSWQQSEVRATGAHIENRTFRINGDTTIEIEIEAWSHQFESASKVHTASAQVQIFDSSFTIASLQRQRIIRIYLPKNYEASNKRFPVLYMQDGQNVFDSYTSAYGEWQADEALDSMYKASGKGLIVVAVDHGGEKRMTEYNPYDVAKIGKGEGRQYARFLATQLKPLIDANFRTLPQKENTWVAGSSMGGLISLFALIEYPQVFGGAGIFSPAFWVAPKLYDTASAFFKTQPGNAVYFYAGGKESESMLLETKKMAGVAGLSKKTIIRLDIDENGRHNEAAWDLYFHRFLWFMQQHIPALQHK